MAKYINITRSDMEGNYTMPLKDVDIQAEFDDLDCIEAGVSVTLTVIEMTEEEYANLPEFMGW